jgi:hypothetical protein
MKTRIKARMSRYTNQLRYCAEVKASWYTCWREVDDFPSVAECEAFIDQYRLDFPLNGEHELYPVNQ